MHLRDFEKILVGKILGIAYIWHALNYNEGRTHEEVKAHPQTYVGSTYRIIHQA